MRDTKGEDGTRSSSSLAPRFPSLILYCRAGFEGECAAEIQERAAQLGVAGFCRARAESGFVEFNTYEGDVDTLLRRLPFASLIFARQIFAAVQVADLPPADRLTPLLNCLGEEHVAGFFVETADTNESKELLALCRKLERPLKQALEARGVLHAGDESLPWLHLFFTAGDSAYVGLSQPGNASPWFMGIPRLRFPKGAPSRSTLKLEEALLFFLDDAARGKRLQPGMRAVDLGAAPGGWTWQLVRRHLHVTAVDNGPMDAALLDSGLVEHRREDGFRFRPAKPVDWLVCDMVEQPGRIAHLVGSWAAQGRCRDSIFNLKLPMKRRYQEVQRCAAIIDELLRGAGVRYTLAFKQLYHDREEVTGYLRCER